MIAIHKAAGGFTERWISYCERNAISYKIVDCYKNDIINQIRDCSVLLWQYYQGSAKDHIMAKALMNAVEHTGIRTFPDFKTAWHFDDKLAQKYLLEAINAPLVPTWVFYEPDEALLWAKSTEFPKVFKLRGGAGSQNVKLVNSLKEATSLIHKAFGKGFPAYDPAGSLKERWRLYKLGKTRFYDLLEGAARFFIPPEYSKVRGREKGYIYFQEFITGNDSDIRVVVIGGKAFAIKRMVRRNDFRASGSGSIMYDKSLIDENIIRLSFTLTEKLQSQCVAYDYVYKNLKPLLVEISYGFSPKGYDPCPGYWDKQMNWHEGKFDPYGWIIDDIVKPDLKLKQYQDA